MKIQMIQHSNSTAAEREGIQFSPMSAPRALDDYDINIIDLSANSLWEYKLHTNIGQVDVLSDLKTLQQMVGNKKKAVVVYVMPQNVRYTYDLQYGSARTNIPIKDIINGVLRYSISYVIPNGATQVDFAFEKTETDIGGKKYSADFYLLNPSSVVTQSIRSEKPTTTKNADNVFVTTLAVTKTNEDLKHYVHTLFGKTEKQDVPGWMADISFGDDLEQQEKIRENDVVILAAKANIKVAEDKLQENAKYKSILYSTGDELVSVVFEILEKLFSCDLSAFEDKKKEDFLIKTENCTFIGEIKGVNSNVKFDNITQIGVHFGRYLDRIAEAGVRETVKQLLIINPFRNKPLNEREPIHKDQIELAVRSGCLIIETNTLLRLFERFCNGEVTAQKCKQVFLAKSGLLSLAEFDEDAGDNEPYKI